MADKAMKLECNAQIFSPQRVFCIGKNYAEHVKELGGSDPGNPVVFMKPPTCLVSPGETIRLPRHGQNLQHSSLRKTKGCRTSLRSF